jgi:hypothetical protein
MSEDSSNRLRRSALAFSTAIRIGTLAVLGSAFFLLTSLFHRVPSVYWRICFVSCALALGILVLGYIVLAWNSPGYGFDGSIRIGRFRFGGSPFTYIFWLLILSGFTSASFGFTARNRLVVLVVFALGSLIGVGLTPLFHYRLVCSVQRVFWPRRP